MANTYVTPAQVASLAAPPKMLAAANAPSNADQLAACQAACDDADAYLSERFTLPLTAFPSSLTYHCAQMVTYALLGRQNYNPQAPGKDTFRQRYEDAMAWLTMIRDGKLTPAGFVDSATDGPATPRFVSNAPRGW